MTTDARPLEAAAPWPESPDVYGYLSLDPRGHWRLRGDAVGRDSLIAHLNSHYQHDDAGRWFVQNGWQRVFVTLAYTPLVARVSGDGRLVAHTGTPLFEVTSAYIDDSGDLLFGTPLGASLLDDNDLAWALDRLRTDSGPVTESALAEGLALPSGRSTALRFVTPGGPTVPVVRLDRAHAPDTLGFVPRPTPAR